MHASVRVKVKASWRSLTASGWDVPLENHHRRGHACIMRNAHVPACGACAFGSKPRGRCKLQIRSPRRRTSYLDIVPGNSRGSIESFSKRLFRGESPRDEGRYIASTVVAELRARTDARLKSFAVTFERAAHSLNRANVNAEPDNHPRFRPSAMAASIRATAASRPTNTASAITE